MNLSEKWKSFVHERPEPDTDPPGIRTMHVPLVIPPPPGPSVEKIIVIIVKEGDLK